MSYRAFQVLQDTTLPRDLYLLGETANGDKQYETEGVAYNAGDYALEENVAHIIREKYDAGELDHLLDEVSREEAEEALNAFRFSTFAPEHEVEHQALAAYGHKIVPRDEVLKARSAGAEDARAAQEEAKAGGADAREGIGQFEGDSTNARLIGVDEGQYVDADTASDEQVQITPSGVVANKFVAKAQAEGSAPAPTSDSSGSGGGSGDGTDEFDALSGDELDKAVADAGIDPDTGGSKQDGGLTADEKRDALREQATS